MAGFAMPDVKGRRGSRVGAWCRRPVGCGLGACSVSAAGEGDDEPAEAESGGAAARQSSTAAGALRAREPDRPGEAERGGDEEVQAQAEDVVGGGGAQELFEDAKAGVAGDGEREQSGRADLPAAPEPAQRAGEREVPRQLVEERGVKRGVVLVAGGAVRGIDLQAPGQVGGA